MPRVLILYGTSDGHTAKIATVMGHALNDIGIATDIVRAGTRDPAITSYDGVIVAASVRAGTFQKPLVACVTRHAAEIAAKPNAFVAVCLGILQRNDAKVLADLNAIVGRFAERTHWTPALIRFIPGALLYTRYNIFTRWVMKRIAAKAGGDTDTSRDYDYTDWIEVRAFAVEFGLRLQSAAA